MTTASTPAQTIARLVPLAEALAALDAVKPVVASAIPVSEAAGHVLAADVTAPRALPPRAQALQDGFAVSAESTHDAGAHAPVMLAHPRRIVAGAPMPDGTDAVAAVNAVQLRGDAADIVAPVASGEGVLAAGGACAAGAVMRCAGARVRTGDVAVFTLAGVTRVSVRSPVLCIACARDSAILAAAADLLVRELRAGNIEARTASFDDALCDERADAVIAIGGTGEGENDNSVNALRRSGRVVFHGVGLSPGETAGFGFIGDKPVLLVPGRLDAALAVWRILGRRMLARLNGDGEDDPTMPLALSRKVTSTVGMAEFVPLRVDAGKALPLAVKYLPLSALAAADGWMLVPASSEGYQAGTAVTVYPWR